MYYYNGCVSTALANSRSVSLELLVGNSVIVKPNVVRTRFLRVRLGYVVLLYTICKLIGLGRGGKRI